MKNIKHFSCLTLLMMVAYFACAQTIDNGLLIEGLKSALFSDSNEAVAVSAFFGHKKQKMDSIYLVRKVQPDLDILLPLFKRIAYSKDTNFIQPLKDMYIKQQSFFKIEWEPVHRNNFYACEAANEQFSILEAFEETIHSLVFGSTVVDKTDKIEYFKAYIQGQYSYYHIAGAWKDAIKKSHIFSPYYLMLRENRWAGPPLGRFSFLEPYIDEIGDQIVDGLSLSDNLNVMSSDYKPTLEQFELDYLCGIISFSETAKFNEKLLDLVLSDKRNRPAYVRSRLLNLVKNSNYKDRTKSHLLKEANSSDKVVRLNALYGLSFFHDTDVISMYGKLLASGNLEDTEKQAIEGHLLMLEKQLNAPKEVKELGANLLKWMRD